MKRIGIFALPLAMALMAQGCIFFPVEESDANDPFFFDPDDSNQGADFVEAAYFQPDFQMSSSVSHPCPGGSAAIKQVDSACWFFPVLRVY